MLLLFNKAKIVSYVVSVFTVVALFCVANSFFSKNDTMQVNSNVIKSENTETQETNIANTKSIMF